MAEVNKKKEEMEAAEVQQPTGQAAEAPAAVETRPNRDRYAAMFGEDNPDVDFEDKEARYGRMAEERERYRNMRNSSKSLSGILDKHRWVGAMLMDEEENPLVWMAKNGIDIRAALDDPEVMQKVTDAYNDWLKRQAEGEAAEKAKDEAIAQSLAELMSVQQEFGLSEEQTNRMWEHFWDDIFGEAYMGKVTKDTWIAMLHAMNYDTDMQNAREEAALQARNEKHANKVKNFEEQQVPPSFGQGSGGRVAPKQEKRESLKDFVKKYS